MKAASLLRMVMVVVPMVIMLRYPFIKDLTVASANYQGGRVIVTGTLTVWFTDEAWSQFGYRDDNFEWFAEWWEEKFSEAKVGPFRLVSVTWSLLEHTATHDRLGFVVVLELRAHASFGRFP